MIIQHNMTSANTSRQLGITTGNLAKSSEKLSSGYRINRAGDDAAGLSISEKMRGQIRGLEQGSTNAQDGISLIQTAEGALNEVHSIVQRMRELTVQASNDTYVDEDRTSISNEMKQLSKEIDRIGTDTEFNTLKLFAADNTKYNFQVGANSDQLIEVTMKQISAAKLGIDDAKIADIVGTAGKTGTDITKLIDTVNSGLTIVSAFRSDLGAVQNRLEHTIANADNTAENLQASESRIRDTNMAKEMVKYSKDNILQQAAQSMLAQANQSTQGVLSLLR
ncbi:flagellin N-terminal helical domain-containing protein [Lachnoclostridium phytofermentans]|uniref:Flagellin n=1 Tax=Lachnoclostridium phytofermentans (strain ATCC 700394 / DSM 18823 / ISDg) TaxID=357809 RepID=A9KSQ8_LACP7|nr:flagellin [Lachnoclostridium phytofermentans]ABX40702.1 flagellin domain protein [Lachnoclostridium phytofermentans ISDg]